jgi:hypothetical protein
MDLSKKNLKKIKTEESVNDKDSDTDRYSGDSISGVDTTAFPVDINDQGELVTKERLNTEQSPSSAPVAYHDLNLKIKSKTAKELEKDIKKKFK